jgi:hypothetical protein
MQLQSWHGQDVHQYHDHPNYSALGTSGEVITFTVVMSVESGTLKFEVINGHSTTWGSFGGQGYLKSTIQSQLENLDTYNLQTSVKQSRIGFASHRVERFSRTAVRLFSGDELLGSQTDEQVVHMRTDE